MNALKRDNGKLPISLIPRTAIEAEAAVMAFGADKYHADNWRQGFAWRRLIDAALRHVHAIADGEDIDPESGLLHAAHARCCLGFLIEHMTHGLGIDDRYRRGPVEPLAVRGDPSDDSSARLLPRMGPTAPLAGQPGVDDRYRQGPTAPLAGQPEPRMAPEEIRRWIDQHVREIPGE